MYIHIYMISFITRNHVKVSVILSVENVDVCALKIMFQDSQFAVRFFLFVLKLHTTDTI